MKLAISCGVDGTQREPFSSFRQTRLHSFATSPSGSSREDLVTNIHMTATMAATDDESAPPAPRESKRKHQVGVRSLYNHIGVFNIRNTRESSYHSKEGRTRLHQTVSSNPTTNMPDLKSIPPRASQSLVRVHCHT